MRVEEEINLSKLLKWYMDKNKTVPRSDGIKKTTLTKCKKETTTKTNE